MNSSAKVTSLDAMRDLRAALVKFEGNARDALTALELEVRRATSWIEEDRRRYWTAQVKLASENLAQARNALERCQLKYGSEEAPSCYEQKKAYERAKRRLRYSEEQVRAVKQWTIAIRHELTTFQGQMARVGVALDTELPRALQALAKMLAALEQYAGGPSRSAHGTGLNAATPSDSQDAPVAGAEVESKTRSDA